MQGRLMKIKIKLLLTANRKSYMPRRLAQQRMTLSGPEWPFHASRAISAVAELLVAYCLHTYFLLERYHRLQTLTVSR